MSYTRVSVFRTLYAAATGPGDRYPPNPADENGDRSLPVPVLVDDKRDPYAARRVNGVLPKRPEGVFSAPEPWSGPVMGRRRDGAVAAAPSP